MCMGGGGSNSHCATNSNSNSAAAANSNGTASDNQKLAEAPIKAPSVKKKSLRMLNSLSNSLRFDNVATVSPVSSENGM